MLKFANDMFFYNEPVPNNTSIISPALKGGGSLQKLQVAVEAETALTIPSGDIHVELHGSATEGGSYTKIVDIGNLTVGGQPILAPIGLSYPKWLKVKVTTTSAATGKFSAFLSVVA